MNENTEYALSQSAGCISETELYWRWILLKGASTILLRTGFFRMSTVLGPKTFHRGELSINIKKCFVHNKQFILIEYTLTLVISDRFGFKANGNNIIF